MALFQNHIWAHATASDMHMRDVTFVSRSICLGGTQEGVDTTHLLKHSLELLGWNLHSSNQGACTHQNSSQQGLPAQVEGVHKGVSQLLSRCLHRYGLMTLSMCQLLIMLCIQCSPEPRESSMAVCGSACNVLLAEAVTKRLVTCSSGDTQLETK